MQSYTTQELNSYLIEQINITLKIVKTEKHNNLILNLMYQLCLLSIVYQESFKKSIRIIY